MKAVNPLLGCALAVLGLSSAAVSQTPPPVKTVLFENVRIFDGKGVALSAPSNVLVRGNKIEKISTQASPADRHADTVIIDGGGRTLMPGLIDAHTHLMFETLPQVAVLTGDLGFISVAAVKAAGDMLMRGFTSVRDLGGPVFGLKRGIDAGLVPGPRIWPSGAFISQTGGHGDFRLPTELPARPGDFNYSERIGATAIADDADTVRLRAREQLALGASQIKLMAGGGVSSSYDPLDVTQYSVPELRAAVEAAENWGTYVTVHAYTPRAVRQALEAGVQCIDHGQLLDEATVKLMAEKGVWWSLQPFLDDGPSTFAEGSPNRIKQLQMFAGTDTAYGSRPEAQDQDRLGNRHPVQRRECRGAGSDAFQDGPLVHTGRGAEDGTPATMPSCSLCRGCAAPTPESWAWSKRARSRIYCSWTATRSRTSSWSTIRRRTSWSS